MDGHISNQSTSVLLKFHIIYQKVVAVYWVKFRFPLQTNFFPFPLWFITVWHGGTPVVPATQEAEAGGLLEPSSSGL